MISYTSLIELQQNIFTEAEKMKVKNAEEFYKTLYLIFDYPYKYYTFKHFEV